VAHALIVYTYIRSVTYLLIQLENDDDGPIMRSNLSLTESGWGRSIEEKEETGELSV
jgi:hypothetical protein